MEKRATAGLPDIPESSWGSKLYWLCRHGWEWLRGFARRHWIKFSLLTIILIAVLFIARGWWQPFAVVVRLYAAPVVFAFLGLLAGSALWTRGRRVFGGGLILFSLVAGMVTFSPHTGPRHYLALWWHYQAHEKRGIDRLPRTYHERIHPRNAVQTLAREGITEVHEVSSPSFVRDGDSYVWTMAIEPAYAVRRLTGNIRELIRVPADSVALNFSGENRFEANFFTGEGMLASRDVRKSVAKRFGPWRFINYQPGSVRYIRDDDGEWVQIVPLVRWKGFLLPRPVFGGVMVVSQQKRSNEALLNVLLGAGEWIPAAEIADHEYLTGQNLVPDVASRFTAQSYCFSQGFLAPMPGYHRGDIRIPDVPGDYNDQPFTSYFEFDDVAKLFHYFALEPFQEDKQGLNTSLFIPADGIGPSLEFRHYDRNQALTGVSAIVSKVMESRKNYDWSRNSAAEQRPFIRDIGGERRFFWLTTVVTHKDGAPGAERSFIVGASPDITLTDAAYKTVVWVDARKPEDWERQLGEELSSVWNSDPASPAPAPEE